MEKEPLKLLSQIQQDVLSVGYEANSDGVDYRGIGNKLNRRTPWSTVSILIKDKLIRPSSKEGPLQEMTFFITDEGRRYFEEEPF